MRKFFQWRACLLMLFLALAVSSPGAAQVVEQSAQDEARAVADEAQILNDRAANVFFLFQDRYQAEDLFSERFLTAVPPAQLAQVIKGIEDQYGPIVSIYSVDRTGPFSARISLRFERAIGHGTMTVSAQDPFRIEGLLFNEFQPIGDGLDKIEAELRALPGDVGVYFGPLDGEEPYLAIDPDRQMAIGSTFKLYVLSALTREMQANNGKYWDDVVFLPGFMDPNLRSFPSGMTQEWPKTAPVTLQTLATLMISISDNTATDELIDYLSEERVVKEMIDSGHANPALNQPFLTTRQMFALKAADEAVRNRYREADREAKYNLVWDLQESDLFQEDVDYAFRGGPVALDIEWFASAHDLRRLLAFLPEDKHDVARQILEINPSINGRVREKFGRVFYKGGSEPGVLNYTWMLHTADGWQVLTMTWNNPADVLDESAFKALAQRLLDVPLPLRSPNR